MYINANTKRVDVDGRRRVARIVNATLGERERRVFTKVQLVVERVVYEARAASSRDMYASRSGPVELWRRLVAHAHPAPLTL